MKYPRIVSLLLVFFVMLFSGGCGKEIEKPPVEDVKINRPTESFLKYGEDNNTIVELKKINPSVWIHTSYCDYDHDGTLVPANGLVVITSKGLVLIDTPWTDEQMESLDKLAKESFNVGIKKAFITHAHQDRLGGVGYLNKNGIETVTLKRVVTKAEELGLPVPKTGIDADEYVEKIDDTEFELFYPGEGHSSDNTVVWINKYNLLFGGCLIQEEGASSLGNVSEANVKEWPLSIQKIKDRYPTIDVVVPGHGEWGDSGLIDYTLELFEK